MCLAVGARSYSESGNDWVSAGQYVASKAGLGPSSNNYVIIPCLYNVTIQVQAYHTAPPKAICWRWNGDLARFVFALHSLGSEAHLQISCKYDWDRSINMGEALNHIRAPGKLVIMHLSPAHLASFRRHQQSDERMAEIYCTSHQGNN